MVYRSNGRDLKGSRKVHVFRGFSQVADYFLPAKLERFGLFLSGMKAEPSFLRELRGFLGRIIPSYLFIPDFFTYLAGNLLWGYRSRFGRLGVRFGAGGTLLRSKIHLYKIEWHIFEKNICPANILSP